MVAGADNRDDGAGAAPSSLRLFVAAVVGLGLVLALTVLVTTDWADVAARVGVGTVLLVVGALVGELRPLQLHRRGDPSETLSMSAPFVLALVATAGLGPALLVQVAGSLTDDVLQRRPVVKSAFNVGQYVLSVVAAGTVYAVLSGERGLWVDPTASIRTLLALLVAGVVMVSLNRLLVVGVVALSIRQDLRTLLREDLSFHLLTQLVLICVGTMAASLADDHVFALALLAPAFVAIYTITASTLRQGYAASHDSLTGLGNRERLYAALDREFEHAARTGGRPPGLVLVDLDHFKDINDTLGHAVGDELLRGVAERLVSALDDPRCAHRLGGDEFAIVVPDGGVDEAERLARDALRRLAQPLAVGDVELLVRASAGVAVAPLHGADSAALMKNADIALYRAKVDRDDVTVFSPELDLNSVDRLRLLADLSTAVEAGQLRLVYQVQVDLRTGERVGVEALLRWDHPTRGAVPPDQFIPVAEQSGLITPITAFVLDRALADLAAWRAQGRRLRLAVNVPARHLSDVTMPERLARALTRYDVPAYELVIEVTETGILTDPGRVDAVIDALRELGVGISVDDYGTGNASLSYLRRLRVDELKLDRSYISGLGTVALDLAVVRSTLALAKELGLRVVAEGIEDEATARLLVELGCDFGQGFHLGRPVPTGEVQLDPS